ncbi:heme-binding protein [Bradyrhizobium sp. RT4b]|uniref:heme-binding protein n=1 Tax=Bradyrhizobium sp. RT4b TaxID=3156379 RepID=UPI00339A644B
MPIDTDFSFAHVVPSTAKGLAAPDLLGPLRPFVGQPVAGKDAQRSWKGSGFNMIWRPNFIGEFGPNDFFLQLFFTSEQIDFTEITGSGIANRSLFEKTVVLGGAAYTQSIKDSFDGSGQHFEPGVWAHTPVIVNPNEPATVIRMGSIPHGTTINLQGTAVEIAGPPTFDPASITPFTIGSADDGATGLVPFPNEEDFTKDSPSRTDRARLAGLKPDHLTNPNLFLSDAIAGQKITRTTALKLSSIAPDVTIPAPRPDVGGGVANIAFLEGKGVPKAGGPNGVTQTVTTTFWIEELDDGSGQPALQLQYTQRVLLNFSGLSWPHITVGTLRPV